MQDPAAFRSLMAYVGCMRDEMLGRVPGPEALSHKLEAIKLVNERLSSGRFDDYTISAVNVLWTQEVRLKPRCGYYRISTHTRRDASTIGRVPKLTWMDYNN